MTLHFSFFGIYLRTRRARYIRHHRTFLTFCVGWHKNLAHFQHSKSCTNAFWRDRITKFAWLKKMVLIHFLGIQRQLSLLYKATYTIFHYNNEFSSERIITLGETPNVPQNAFLFRQNIHISVLPLKRKFSNAKCGWRVFFIR
jgi:hypothetical protein